MYVCLVKQQNHSVQLDPSSMGTPALSCPTSTERYYFVTILLLYFVRAGGIHIQPARRHSCLFILGK